MANFASNKALSLKKAEEFWIQLCREPGWEGYVAFTYYVFGFMPEPFHIDWLKKFASEERRQLMIAPRGSAKTTYLCIAMLKYMADNPWDANLLLSVSAAQALERLTFIRNTFDNERFQKVYPWLQIDINRPDTQSQFTVWDTRYSYGEWRTIVARNGGELKSPTFKAGGISNRGITGGRVTGIMAFDDVTDEDNARTAELRQQLWDRITNVIMPLLLGDHYRLWSIGTRWADGDVPSRQIATGIFQYTELKAITRIGDKLKSFWQKLFPFKELINILNSDGKTTFLLQRMNSITALRGAIFTADMLRTDYPRDPAGRPIFPEFDRIVLSVDAAIKATEARDDSAIAIIGLCKSPHTSLPQMWILDLQYGHWKNMEVLENLERLWHNAIHNFKAKDYYVLFETVAGQQLFLTLMDVKPDFTIDAKYIDTYTPVSDKGTRARSTAAAGERGDLIINTRADWYDKWFSQCVEFTGQRGNADDLVDVMTQVGVKEFGDLNSNVAFSPKVHHAHISGLSMI